VIPFALHHAGRFLSAAFFAGRSVDQQMNLSGSCGRRMSRGIVDPHIKTGCASGNGLPSLVEAVFTNTSPQVEIYALQP